MKTCQPTRTCRCHLSFPACRIRYTWHHRATLRCPGRVACRSPSSPSTWRRQCECTAHTHEPCRQPSLHHRYRFSVNESSLAVGLISLPISFIDGSITPDLISFTVSEVVLGPVALVPGVVLECLHLLLRQVLVVIDGALLVVEGSQIRSDLLHTLVLSLDLLLT